MFSSFFYHMLCKPKTKTAIVEDAMEVDATKEDHQELDIIYDYLGVPIYDDSPPLRSFKRNLTSREYQELVDNGIDTLAIEGEEDEEEKKKKELYDYTQVQRWTRNFDLFELDFVFIPVNEQFNNIKMTNE